MENFYLSSCDNSRYSFGVTLNFRLFSYLPAIIADSNDGQQVNEQRHPLSICQTRHLLQTFKQPLSCPTCEDNTLRGFCEVFKEYLQIWECCCY